jgi:hypothetical protein
VRLLNPKSASRDWFVQSGGYEKWKSNASTAAAIWQDVDSNI